MRAVITAGGTSEPIDDVRVVTNLSTGRFGAAIATALHQRGVAVTVVGSRSMLLHDWLPAGVRRVCFGSFAELRRAIDAETHSPPDLFFMAAAVSDYAPVPTQGKIRSTSDRLTIEMVKTPKILPTLRDRCPSTYLVGFKLLSGVPTQELIEVAQAQLKNARLDLSVANDLQTFEPGVHPVVLVESTQHTHHTGSKQQMAVRLVEHVLDTVGGADSGHLDGATEERLPALPTHRVHRFADTLAVGSLPLRGSVEQTLAHAAPRAFDGGPFVVEGEEVWVGSLDPRALFDVQDRWTKAIGRTGRLMFADQQAVGLLLTGDDGRSLWIAPEHRGRSYGDRLVRALGEQEHTVWVRHEHTDFFVARGFRVERRDETHSWLRPPSTYPLSPAASVCLFDPLQRRVLLGLRKRGAYLHHWSFPGGGQEAGETALQCARRELEEETGLVAPYPPAFCTSLAVGDGQQAWRVENYAIPSLGTPPPLETDELAARWFDLKAAHLLERVTAGTRTVLHALEARIG